MDQSVLRLQNLSVGYGSHTIVRDISVDFRRGRMTCILGSNGAGKTTLLKTVCRLLPPLAGEVWLNGRALRTLRSSELAREMAVVLTNKVDIENLTGFEAAAMGRYPHTGFFCRLSDEDYRVVEKYLRLCSAEYLRDKYFQEMSDGEKQKIMLVRGLAQEAPLLLLDEPTSHLDIKHKLELLHALRTLCLQEGRTIICTLHEPDLAIKSCDDLVLVKEDRILSAGTVEEVLGSGTLDTLYGFSGGQFNPLLGTVEFQNPPDREVFILGSDENTLAVMRELNKFSVGFGIGVLRQNEIAYHVAATMGAAAVAVPPFAPVTETALESAAELAAGCQTVLLSDCPADEGSRALADRLRALGSVVLSLTRENWRETVQKICEKKVGR